MAGPILSRSSLSLVSKARKTLYARHPVHPVELTALLRSLVSFSPLSPAWIRVVTTFVATFPVSTALSRGVLDDSRLRRQQNMWLARLIVKAW